MPVIINDQNYRDFISPVIDGETKHHGLKPRNYGTHPSGYQACAPTFDAGLVLPENEWSSRLADQVAARATMFDVRQANHDTLKSLDQDGLGLCWAFSTTKAMMYRRIVMGSAPLILSAWWVAGVIKGWRDQGGWGAESLERVAANGVPEMSFCPSYRSSYDTAATRANALLHKATEWWDGTDSRDQNRRIMISAFLMGLSPVLDYNWWSHSVCGCRLVSIDPLVIDIDNSWGSSAGDDGIFRLEGSKAIPDGLVIPRVTIAA